MRGRRKRRGWCGWGRGEGWDLQELNGCFRSEAVLRRPESDDRFKLIAVVRFDHALRPLRIGLLPEDSAKAGCN